MLQRINKTINMFPYFVLMQEHKHFTNHLTNIINAKILDTFKDLFSNINVDSIQETYPKISVYNKIITQYIEGTNIKHSLNLNSPN